MAGIRDAEATEQEGDQRRTRQEHDVLVEGHHGRGFLGAELARQDHGEAIGGRADEAEQCGRLEQRAPRLQDDEDADEPGDDGKP